MLRITANSPGIAAPRPSAEMRSGAAVAGFAQQLQSTPAGRGSVVGGPAALSSVGSLVALQEIRPPRQTRRSAIVRGEALLDGLAGLQSVLLADGEPSLLAERLQRRLEDDARPTEDPALAALLDAIELRVQVELAKLERRSDGA